MKKAIGNYEGVKAFTREEALALIPQVFTAEYNRARAEFVELGGYSPDWRAINFIAADRRNAVYSFVYCTTRKRNEVWIYDGETCPDAKAIKKRGQVIWAENDPTTNP